MKILQKLALCFSILFGAGNVTADDWQEYKSENLIIYSNIQASIVRGLIKDTERLRPYLSEITGIKETRTPLPLTMYLYRTTSDLLDIVGERQVLGIYRPLLKGGFAVTVGINPIDPRKLGGRSVVLHEYVHHYLAQLSPLEYPIWYAEGFADLLSNITYNRNSTRVGNSLTPRVGMLNDRSIWAGVSQILTATNPDIGKKRDWRGHDRFYSQAWLLAHMVTISPKFSENTPKFLTLLSNGTPPAEAVASAYDMTINKFGKAYRSYWKQGILMPYLEFDKASYSEPVIVSRTLDKEESRALRWRSQLDFAESPERIAELALEIHTEVDKKDSALLRVLYSESLLKFGRPDLAMDQIIQAIAMDPDNIDAHFMKAQIMLDIAMKRYTGLGPDAVNAKDYADIYHSLDGVIADNPDNAHALYQVGIVHFLDPNSDLAGEGLTALNRAAYLLPQSLEVRLLLAQAHEKLGDVGEACKAAGRVLQYSHDKKLRKRATEILHRLSEGCPA